MIKYWLIRGDCHGDSTWMNDGCLDGYKPEETAIIILGDAGWNFWVNKQEARHKKEIDQKGYYFYLVRGNHEVRPQNLFNIELIYDDNVNGNVWYEPEYPHIRYFKDFSIYNIANYNVLVIGGAYSVDKWYRLGKFGLTPETNIPKKSGWFNDEMLSVHEMELAEQMIDEYLASGYKFDFIFTHTCPQKFEPTDLFLSFIEQSKVDKSMEIWMDKIYEKIETNSINKNVPPIWCFGHFHADRIEAPYVEQYYNDIEDIDNLHRRWYIYGETGELDWWIIKGPRMKA